MKPTEYPAVPPPEFSRVVVAESLPGDQIVREIEASVAECRALAVRFRLEAVLCLRATVHLARLRGRESGMVRVSGTVSAEVVQACVVTMEPVPASVCESFSALFSPDITEEEADIAFDPFAAEEDQPEPMADGLIDIGELVAQHLSLALDPYPRAPGVEFSGFDDDERAGGVSPGSAAEESSSNPFGALAGLKLRQ